MTVAFESADGTQQITTGDAFVDSLQPGQSSPQDVNGFQSYAGAFKCVLFDAQRTESSL